MGIVESIRLYPWWTTLTRYPPHGSQQYRSLVIIMSVARLVFGTKHANEHIVYGYGRMNPVNLENQLKLNYKINRTETKWATRMGRIPQ